MNSGSDIYQAAWKRPELRRAAAALAPGRTVRVRGVWGSAAPLAAAAMGERSGRGVLLVLGHLDQADEAADDIELLCGRPATLLPAWELEVGSDHVNAEVAAERLRVCADLLAGSERPPLVVAPVMSLLQPVPAPEALGQDRLELRVGGRQDLDALLAWLVDGGYEAVEQVDRQGEFAHRGGIVDIFAAGANEAIRVELFGDEIDSIRRLDLDSQRSSGELQSFSLTGARAVLEGLTASFLDYLPADAAVIFIEGEGVMDLAGEMYRRAADSAAAAGAALLEPESVFAGLASRPTAELEPYSASSTSDGDGAGETIDLGIRSLERLAVQTREALGVLERLAESCRVEVFCENDAERRRFREVLAESCPTLAERAVLSLGHLHAGFHWPQLQWVAVGHHEIFHRYAKVRRLRRVRSGRPIDSVLDLAAGDYVVHVSHGIAKFQGLRHLETDGKREEYLTLQFADNAKMHVPASQIQLVQKYIGVRGRRPSLSKLGGAGWSRQKQRVEDAVRDMAAEMLRIQALRQASPGISYPRGSEWYESFRGEFIYSETEDQIVAMGQIEEDMAVSRPMDRLLCGDVGYGKTELAMRAAFKVAESGRQVAVLVPTTVLATQHYRSFRERMADYPVRVEVLSRFRSAAEQKEICRRLTLGEIDILIGTHRILSRDVAFADLGLVVIDEEQRFGVEHKERLKAMRATVDVLTMTATPIPRTLHMALLGLRDISALSTPPMDRRAIHTEVLRYDESALRAAMLRELSREGQVFFVHNRVQDIDRLAERLRELLPEGRFAVAHGQMAEGELERTMIEFVRGEADVLVCTTIIESGLDIPRANTMIVHEADRFGLAQLHQLRGRVGRSQRRAYCLLLLPERRPVRPEAARRLKAVEEFSDLGAGFQIAMRDLELRGAGNILGAEQSGHIATVGYELFCQLLESAVRDLKGEDRPVRVDAHVELGVDIYIPRDYIPSDRQRMEVYRRLAGCTDVQQLHQLADDLDDAYGRLDEDVRTLLEIAEIRVHAAHLGIRSILLKAPDVIFRVEDFRRCEGLFDDAPGSVRLPDERTVHWRPPEAYLQQPTIVHVLRKRMAVAAGQDGNSRTRDR